MAEYIEREAVIHRIRKVATMIGFENPAVAIDSAITVIERAPTADVAQVRHAKWEECHWVEPDGPYGLVAHPKAAFRCSGCKYVFKKELLWKDNYCPNCGAKCDLEG